jgi:hypothetical protein
MDSKVVDATYEKELLLNINKTIISNQKIGFQNAIIYSLDTNSSCSCAIQVGNSRCKNRT